MLGITRVISSILCLAALSVYAQPASSDSSARTPADQFVKDSNTFSFSLQQTAMRASENAVFSPYSIFTCLSMVYAGAKNDTAQEIKKALSLNLNAVEAAHASSFLRKSLITPPREGCGLLFTSANGLFADQDTFILSSFRDLVQKNYQAEIASLNFSQRDKALMTINGWISNETKGKITDLLKTNDIDSSTRLVLINTAYFLGKWLKPFDPKATQDLPFHTVDDETINTPMMEQTGSFYYYEDDSTQILSLPFQICDSQDPNINCIFVLPKSSQDMADLDKSLSTSVLNEWIDQLSMQKVTAIIPRFCIKKRVDLGTALAQMGMPNAFTEKADFSGIDGMHDLFLSKVLHETYFSLNEFGVEAAAPTSAVINVTATPDVAPPVLFTADHPFYFFLIDRKSNALLFAGKLFKPDASACP